MITVNASAAPDLGPGDMLDLIGPERDIDALARDAGTIAHEILAALGPRYHRVYSEG
jgi:alanine racemase